MKRRKHNVEMLECRQLMASDLDSTVLLEPMVCEGLVVANAPLGSDASLIAAPSLPIYYPPETGLMQAIEGGTVFVTNHPDGQGQTLWRINDAGEVRIGFQTELDFRVNQILDAGDRLYLIGYKPFGGDYHTMAPNASGWSNLMLPYIQEMVLAAVDSQTGEILARKEFADGIQQIKVVGDKLLVASQSANLYPVAFYLQPTFVRLDPLGSANAIQTQTSNIRDDSTPKLTLRLLGLVEGEFKTIAETSTAPGNVEVQGNRILVTTTEYPAATGREWLTPLNTPVDPKPNDFAPPTYLTKIRAFLVTGDRIKSVGEPVKVEGFSTTVRFSEDGKSVLVYRSRSDQPQSQTTFSTYTFTEAGLTLKGTLALDISQAYIQPLYLSDELLVVEDWSLPIVQKWLVWLRDGKATVEKFGTADQYLYPYSYTKVGDNVVAFGQQLTAWPERGVENASLSTSDPNLSIRFNRQVMIVFSLKDRSYRVTDFDTDTQWINELRVIDEASGRIGFMVGTNQGKEDWGVNFEYGSIKTGEFVSEGSFKLPGTYSFSASRDQFLIHTGSNVLIYDYGNEEPRERIELPLPPIPPPVANDDHFVLYSTDEDPYLSLLADDVAYAPIKIIELIGAPEGTEIKDGLFVKIPAESLAGKSKIEFSYVISDGQEQSTAKVSIEIVKVNSERVEALVQSVRKRAADDYDVDLEKVKVVSVTPHIYNNIWPSDFITRADAPYYLVSLQLPDIAVSYRVDLTGEINLVDVKQRVVQIGTRVVDEAGELRTEVRVGDTFILEVFADDLRSDGNGVFATSINLAFPESVKLVGEIETVAPFTAVHGAEVTQAGVRKLGALSRAQTPPGPDTQVVFRLAFEVIGTGSIEFFPELSRAIGGETLVYNVNEKIEPSSIVLSGTVLEVVNEEEDPQDVDGDGNVVSMDVLHVINFIELNGAGTIEELAARMDGSAAATANTTAESKPHQERMRQLRRYDATRDNAITPLDALVVINRVNLDVFTSNQKVTSSATSVLVDPNQLPGNENKKRR